MYTIDKAKSQANTIVTISFEVYFSLGLSMCLKRLSGFIPTQCQKYETACNKLINR